MMTLASQLKVPGEDSRSRGPPQIAVVVAPPPGTRLNRGALGTAASLEKHARFAVSSSARVNAILENERPLPFVSSRV